MDTTVSHKALYLHARTTIVYTDRNPVLSVTYMEEFVRGAAYLFSI